MRILLFWRWS